jgi:hypothetical protein
MIDCTVVINDCFAPARPNIRDVRLTATRHGSANFSFGVDRLVAPLPDPLTPRQLDWLTIAASLYAADLACERGIDLDWARDIELHIPVNEPDHWNQFTPRIEDAFGRLTYDALKVTFHAQDAPTRPPRQRRRPFADAQAVALLSGGVDSFVGGVELLGRTPETLFVSHTAASVTREAQQNIEPVLRGYSQAAQFAPFTAGRRGGFGAREGSERSRTILFLSCAGLVAAALSIRDIYLNENGVLAVHIPLTDARIGSLSTRTASPSFLDDFGSLMSDALDSSLAIRNLLLTRTKPEVIELAMSLGCQATLPRTVSCWSIGHTRRHCGYCAPCMIRRISCELHNAPDVRYETDIFTDGGVIARRPFARDNLMQLIETVSAIETATDEDLELDFPELLNGGRDITAAEAREMHRRWADQSLRYLRTRPVPSAYL